MRSAPPSPHDKFLVSWKLWVASAPIVPSARPRHAPHSPCALSSTTIAPAASAIWPIASISHPTPA